MRMAPCRCGRISGRIAFDQMRAMSCSGGSEADSRPAISRDSCVRQRIAPTPVHHRAAAGIREAEQRRSCPAVMSATPENHSAFLRLSASAAAPAAFASRSDMAQRRRSRLLGCSQHFEQRCSNGSTLRFAAYSSAAARGLTARYPASDRDRSASRAALRPTARYPAAAPRRPAPCSCRRGL